NISTKTDQEPVNFTLATMNYSSESHLEFEIVVHERSEYPWPEPRSILPNVNYNESLKVTNIGDAPTGSDWNVTLHLTPDCNVTDAGTGTYNDTADTIKWQVPDIDSRESAYLNFTVNCSSEGRHIFSASAVRDTRGSAFYEDSVNIHQSQQYTFSSPSADYQKLREIRFRHNRTYSGTNLTIGESSISILGDSGQSVPVSLNHEFEEGSEWEWSNATLSGDAGFEGETHALELYSHSDAMQNAYSDVAISMMNYTWDYGKLFQESQPMFTKVKTFEYYPLNENETIDTQQDMLGGWGEPWNFSIMVRDRFGRNVTTTLYHKKGAADYTPIDTYLCPDCLTWTKANMTYDYVCSDIGEWKYLFSINNSDGEVNTSEYIYSIEQDDTDVFNLTPTWNFTVNRSQPYNFTLLTNDTDNQTIPSSLNYRETFISVSKTGSNETYETYYPVNPINSTGHIVYTMTNDTTHWCKGWAASTGTFYLGQNYWKGGISSSTCYKDNITEPSPYNALPFWLMGSLYPSLISPDTSANYSREDTVPTANYTITFNGTSVDDCLDYKASTANFPVSFTAEHDAYTTTMTANSLSGNYYTYSWNPGSSAPYGWYNITILSYTGGTYTDKYWNGSYTLENAFFLASVPALTPIEIEPGTTGCWGQSPFNFTVNASDDDNNTVNVTMYLNSTYTSGWELYNYSICTDCNRTDTITFSRNFTCGEKGTWDVLFVADDTSGFSYNVTSQFEVTKENMTVNETSGSGASVNRSDSEPGSSMLLAFQIWDTIKNQTTVAPDNNTEVFTWVRSNPVTWTLLFEMNNTTHYYHTFNPTCSYTPGQRYWKVNTTSGCYRDYETAEYPITIFGTLTPNLTYPTSLVSYDQSDNITFNGTIDDDCGGGLANASVRFMINSTGGGSTFYCPSPTGFVTNTTGSYYECEWNSSSASSGYYNVTMLAYKSYYNNGSDTNYGIFIVAPVSLVGEGVTPGTGGWGDVFNFSVNVSHYTNVTVCLNESDDNFATYDDSLCKDVTLNSDSKVVSFNETYV
ncbi:MAG: Ig-like domain-containing protein, partial [Candidatus Thorarchaeota archaeon]